jgi:CMP-N-acetylneuraminic acid synthetase/protein-L-isoaspartate O-methyltransferase
MKHYAIIPAKERSSRCNNKNWRSFTGKDNLVEYLISIIPDHFFDKVILSTDKDLKSISDTVTVHQREKHLATNESPVNDTIHEVIKTFHFCDDAYIWLLNPTSPFRATEDFFKIRELLDKEKPTSIISVTKINPFIWKDNHPTFYTGYPRKNTQDFKERFAIENGQFIVFNAGEFEKTKTWYGSDSKSFEQDRYETLVDIDTEEDFCMAQNLVKKQFPMDTLKNETLCIDFIIADPIKEHTQILFNHFKRYASAIQQLNILKTETVVDASCGMGYGTYLVSTYAKNVIGLDINDEYLQKSKRMYDSENIDWFSYDEFDQRIQDNILCKPDKIICIETLEHIPQKEMVAFYRKLCSYLKTGGDLFLTVPLGDDKPSEYNQYHLNEPSIGILYQLFSNQFHRVQFEISTFKNSFGYDTKFCLILLNGYKGEGA